MDVLKIGYTSFSENKINRQLLKRYLLYLILNNKEQRIKEVECLGFILVNCHYFRKVIKTYTRDFEWNPVSKFPCQPSFPTSGSLSFPKIPTLVSLGLYTSEKPGKMELFEKTNRNQVKNIYSAPFREGNSLLYIYEFQVFHRIS